MKRKERRKKRRLKLRTLFMLSLTLIFNTYAWFLYVTTVSTNMQVHVDAWSVNFEVDGTAIEEKEFPLIIDHAYPGMEDVEKTVTVKNTGEKDAELTSKMIKLRILDKIYIVKDELSSEQKAQLTGAETEITSEEMERMLNEDFPFKVTASCTATELAINGEANVSMKFTWQYDNNNDELDTKYGVDSYNYYKNNEGKPAIEAVIKIKAQQKT